MSATAVRSPTEYESQLRRYLFERSEEGRAVRVGEKEISEQAAIVARYADLFSRDQLDVHVGADDGRELLAELRAERPEVPIALFSGTTEPRAITSFGADAIIPKPFTLDELAGTVERLAGSARV